ncbi:MAG: hypothetical protein QMD04_14385 [Anaerolineales bacterium]|nr:hypothetical protein [Anaerolineales bacterium]
MIAGVYLVLARGWSDNVWTVALAGVPFGLSVVSINIGKHIDKSSEDKKKRGWALCQWPAWPAWFSGFAFYHNRLFANLFTLGPFADVLLRIFLSGFWPVR